MPHARYKDKYLTLDQILEAVDTGCYRVLLEEGRIISRKTDCDLFIYNHKWPPDPNQFGHWFVRLYFKGRHICTSRARIIWMVGHRREIPPDFEIHHADENSQNDSFDNLVCVYKPDHKKLHKNGKMLGVEAIPF